MTPPEKSSYVIDDRQWIAKTPDVRVQILTLGKGQEVPWHYHTTVTDTFFCLDGPMVVNTNDKNTAHELQVGETYDVPPKTAHQVMGKDWGPCRFLIVQGVGEYDFVPAKG